MLDFLKPKALKKPDLNAGLSYVVYDPCNTARLDQKAIARLFARVFLSEDGKKVLHHLQTMTFHRALGPGSSDDQLRYLEGQRSLVANILKLVEQGRGR